MGGLGGFEWKTDFRNWIIVAAPKEWPAQDIRPGVWTSRDLANMARSGFLSVALP